MAPPQSETHNPLGQPDAAAFTAELRSIYLDFFRRICFDNFAEACSPDSCPQVTVAVTALCRPFIPSAVIKVCSSFPSLMCKYYPVQEQVKIAHFTALVMVIDDLAQRLTGEARDVFLEDLALFQMKMCDPQGYASAYPGRGDLHGVLEDFMHYLRTEQNPFFPAHPRTLTMLVKSSFDFLEGNLLEQHYQEYPIKYIPEMKLFGSFLRAKTGVAEAFACFVLMDISGDVTSPMFVDRLYYNNIHPMIPELIETLNFINDIMSFYKELEDGDTAITILINAKVKKQSPLDALRDIIDLVVEQRIRIMAIIEASGSLEWKKRIQQFYQGYIAWHLGGSRYIFKQLLGDWFQGEYKW